MNWYRLAAEQGNKFAHFNLGKMYKEGRGVPQDYVRAHMSWNIAASSGYKYASELRDNVAKKMTPAQIAEAKKLAKECLSKKYKGC